MSKKTVSSHYKYHSNHYILLLSTLAFVLMAMSSSALAEVSEITISPENPQPGDTVTVSGKAEPGEVVDVSIGFTKIQTVSGGEFEYNIGKVTIPEFPGSSSFSLKAEGVDTLDLSVSILGIPISVPDRLISYSGNIASFGTGKISSGTYDITIGGTSSSGEVSLSFGARGSLTADENGDFSYSYTTSNIPAGDFSYSIGGQSGTVPFGTSSDDGSSGSGSSDDDSSSSSSSTKKSSSHTGTEYEIVPADTLGDDNTGVGEETATSDSSESLESSADSDYQEGYVMTNQTSSSEKLTTLGTAGIVVGVFCIGAIFLGYRKNKFK